MEIKNLQSLTKKFKDMAAKARKDGEATVAVGYTANYALWVHENIEMKWRGFPRDRSIRKDGTIAETGHTATGRWRGLFWGPHGHAKFLEQPARQLTGVLSDIVAKAMQEKKTMAQALLLAGLRLQRESQELVPVDTGNLRASAFTRLE